MAAAVAAGALFGGCIGKPMYPAATQPSTVIDPATTQPSYWLAMPAAASVPANDFDVVWDACKTTARGYGYPLDREDFRGGVITTVPQASKQALEFWRHDSGTAGQTAANSMATIRRSIRFEVARTPEGNYAAVPKVLVERLSILERRVSDVSQYRYAFAGPNTKTPPKQAVPLDPETDPNIPYRYWTPIGRDMEMEAQIAARLTRELSRREAAMAKAGPATPPVVAPPATVATGPRLEPDGIISAIGPDGVVYVNVGASEKVVPGMTFELYADRAVLPTLEAYGRENSQSKGWVEVVTVGNGSSACRVIAAGKEPPKAGDQISNFVFRRQQANHFAVVGDLTADRATVTGLITRWGGVVDPRVTPDTTYLILGRPPSGEAARGVYDTARSQAELLKIPVLSEERFDLFIRYYDPARR